MTTVYMTRQERQLIEAQKIERVLNQTASYDTSSKYKPISSAEIIRTLEDKGFKTRSVIITNTKKEAKQGFQKHMIRMNHDGLQLRSVGETRPELLIVNSHDATTALQFRIGLYRLVCSNGLVLGQTIGNYKINHLGDVQSGLNAAYQFVNEKLPLIDASLQRLQGYTPTFDQIHEFKEASVRLLELPNTANYDLSSIGRPMRQADFQQDGWTVFNRVQESIIRTGVRYNVLDLETGESSRQKTREIKSIDRQLKVNSQLFDLALEHLTSEAA